MTTIFNCWAVQDGEGNFFGFGRTQKAALRQARRLAHKQNLGWQHSMLALPCTEAAFEVGRFGKSQELADCYGKILTLEENGGVYNSELHDDQERNS